MLNEGSSFLRSGLLPPIVDKVRVFILLKRNILWIFNRDLLLAYDQCIVRWGALNHGCALSEHHVVGWLVELNRLDVRFALG